MPFSTLDFGSSVIPLTGTDAFFLDTNMFIAYFDEKDAKHLACFCLVSYLVKNDAIICISEVVLIELVNTLARMLYCDDKYAEYVRINGEAEYKNAKLRGFRNDWSSRVLKLEPEILNYYNTMAVTKLSSFIEKTMILECNDEITIDYMRILTEKNLASSDAMIVAIALNFGCQYFDYVSMIQLLSIKDYLLVEMGDTDFINKFPLAT
jgi:predicted nucleic acid-binding protein